MARTILNSIVIVGWKNEAVRQAEILFDETV